MMTKEHYFEAIEILKEENPKRYEEIIKAFVSYFSIISKGHYDDKKPFFEEGKDARRFSEEYSKLRKLLIETPQTTHLPLPPNHTRELDEFIGNYVEQLFNQNK